MSAVANMISFTDPLPCNCTINVEIGAGHSIKIVTGAKVTGSLGAWLIAELSLDFQCDDLKIEDLDRYFEVKLWDGKRLGIVAK